MGGGMGGPGGPHRRPEETAAEEGSGDGGHSGPSRPTININFKKHGKRFWITWAIVAVVVIGFCYWWFHPSLNIHSADLWWFVGIFLCVPAFLIFRSLYNSNQAKAEVNIDRQKKATRFKRLSWIPVIVILVGILGAFASSTFFPFNAARYSAVLHTDEYDFASDIPEVDYSQIPVIDHDSAVILGNRAMGTIPDYVSQFEISDLYSQINYHDTPVRVSPLGYADFFKWITNRTPGIPAYVLVDMTTQNTQIVRLNEAMKYTQSEPFARNIDRYVQLKYPFYMFEQLAFEIDEEGDPHHRALWRRDHRAGGAGGRLHRRVQGHARRGRPRVGRPRLSVRPAHHPVQLVGPLPQRLVELVHRAARRAPDHAGDRREAWLQLPRQG